MTKKSLKFVVPVRTLAIGDKVIKIPRMGLRQYQILKEVKSCDDTVKTLLDSIHAGLTAAEAELVMLNLFAFNGKCLDEKDGLKLSDVKICTETEFTLGDTVYKFNPPALSSTAQIDDAEFLSEHYIGVETDFHQFPAFIRDWATGLRKTVSLETPSGTVYGGLNILELFK